ncbi:MAG: DUF4252 domain-containing protein [Pseudomonadota bacterium]
MNARTALLIFALVSGPLFAQNKGQLLLPELPGLAAKASESVNVNLGPELLGIAARFLSNEDPEEAAAKKLATSLTGIYVRNYSFDADYAYPKADIERVRQQLKAPGWNRMVETHSTRENTDVDVYVLIENGRAKGLAIIASEPREFTIVNIVGSIDLDQLHDLQKLGVPDLELETGKKPAPVKPAAAPPAAAPGPKK